MLNRLHQIIADQRFVVGASLIFVIGIFFFPIFLDQGVFLTGGWLLHHGKRLYLDFYDNKPPGIYLWNELKVSLFSGVGGWHFLEAVSNVLLLLIVWRALANTKTKTRLYFLIAFGAFAFFPSTYEYGGMTEFYGSIVVLGSLLLYQRRQAFLAGVVMVLSVWCKEPFVVFFLFPLFFPPRRSARLQYFLGLGSGLILTLTFYTMAGILTPYGQVLRYNLTYVHQKALWENLLPKDFTQLVKILPRFLPLFLAVYLGFTKTLSRRSAYFTLAGVMAIAIGQRYYGHYFLFLLPAWLSLLQDLVKLNRPSTLPFRALDLFILFSLSVQIYVIVLQTPKQKQQFNLAKQITAVVSADKTLFTEVSNVYLYPLTGLKPQPLSALVTIEDLYRTRDGMLDSVKVSRTKADFTAAFPDYLYRPEEIFWFDPIWLRHYVEKSIPGFYERRKGE
jgi:hypothetical protein